MKEGRMKGVVLVGLAALAAAALARLTRRKDGGHKPIGYQPGSPGDVSTRIGTDVRDLIMAGYSERQIARVANGEITLEQLLRSRPEKGASREGPQG
jgi:hypothetical protein